MARRRGPTLQVGLGTAVLCNECCEHISIALIINNSACGDVTRANNIAGNVDVRRIIDNACGGVINSNGVNDSA